MVEPNGDAIRERIEPIDVASIAVLGAVAYLASGDDPARAIPFAGVVLAIPLFRWASAYVGVSGAVQGILLGSSIGVLGAWGIVFEGANWVGPGLVVVGGWIVLDSIYESRHGEPNATEPEDDISEVEMYTLMGHSQWVIEALQEAERPLSSAELQAETGLTEDELEDVLEISRDNGTVDRVGSGYVVDERQLGGFAFVRGIVDSVGRRLLRPSRLFRPTR